MAEESRSPVERAADRIRETAKWLTVSLAALGTVLIAGTQLSSIGSLQVGGLRFWFAVISAVFAGLCIAAIFSAVVSTATAPMVTLEDLARRPPLGTDDLINDQIYLSGFANVEKIYDAYIKALADRHKRLEDYYDDAGNDSVHQEAETANARLLHLNSVARPLVRAANYRTLAHRWKKASVRIAVAGILSGISLIGFVWAVNPPPLGEGSTASSVTLGEPELGKLLLNREGRLALQSTLGQGCPISSEIDVVILANEAAGVDVLVDDPRCSRIRVFFSPDWGVIGEV